MNSVKKEMICLKALDTFGSILTWCIPTEHGWLVRKALASHHKVTRFDSYNTKSVKIWTQLIIKVARG